MDNLKELLISNEEILANEIIGKNDWVDLCINYRLSEDFIREFKNQVLWTYISQCQKLSEDFIREFKDKVNWHWIYYKQNLSKEFKKEFKKEIHRGFL